MKLAPIVLFAYNRPWHTEQTLNALMLNKYADKSKLYIYCDGSKEDANKVDLNKINEVRTLVRKKKWCKKVIIIERDKNFGLANNVLDGISSVINKYKKVIVIEDDMITSKGFLDYMNFSLNYYEKELKVFHINGHNYKSNFQFVLDDYYFSKYMNCWGWATWKDRWDKLNKDYSQHYNKLVKDKNILHKYNYESSLDFHNQLLLNINNRINTWAILWYSTIFFNKGYCLTSKRSYVENIGLDGTGEHCLKIETKPKIKISNKTKTFKGGIEIKEKQKARLHLRLYYEFSKPLGFYKFFYRTIKKNIFR